ncbi:MAG: YafY family transcriptional regulator [Sphingobacteriaceae bacterium]|nr:MAG: YafY family transcriptional regulator [Sphingobacteriaceae bacterium]
MNRIDRISAILIHLQSRKVVKAQDIADRFGISLRTVYRDIKTLEEAGVPLIGEAGVGYSLVDSYRLPPVMFTREEATAFITAEKLVEKLTDTANSNHYQSAMFKVKAVLKSAEKDFITHINERIEVLKSERPPSINSGVQPIQLILKAIAEKRILNLHYFAYYRQEQTQRLVEPVGVFYQDNYWHLIGWCKTRLDYRDFRFDRITDLTLCDEYFADKHPSLKTYLDKMYQDKNLVEIKIRVKIFAAKHLGEQKYYHGFIDEVMVDDGLEMTFLTTSLEGFARWFLMFADYAKIIQPLELKDRIKNIIQKIVL